MNSVTPCDGGVSGRNRGDHARCIRSAYASVRIMCDTEPVRSPRGTSVARLRGYPGAAGDVANAADAQARNGVVWAIGQPAFKS